MFVRDLSARAVVWAAWIRRWLASETCFYVIVGLLAVQAAWLALSARYPMAFDENFHFGLIQLHASQWLPFFTHQPAGADQFGPVIRDPSYLYHFLLSIPYRLIRFMTGNQTLQIVVLRFINITMGLWGLLLARRVLWRLNISRALAHSVLLLVCLVPIVPFLAAQINYDNLFIPLTLLALLGTFQWIDNLHEERLDALQTSWLCTLLLVASIVKYPFLPIAAALAAIMAWQCFRHRAAWPSLWRTARRQLKHSAVYGLLAGIVLVATLGLFTERYGINLLRYHTPNPDCAQVLSDKQCLSYSPWARDYAYAHDGINDHPSKLAYLWQWPFGLWFRSFFAISHTYDTQPPLPLPGGASIALAALGLLLVIRYARRLFAGNVYRQTVCLTLALYMAALFWQTFQAYLHTGEPVAINGRYLLPFLPAIFAFVGLAYQQLWKRETMVKSLAVTLSILLFAQGGGMFAFVIRSQDSWYWPNAVVVTINHDLRNVLKAVVAGS